MKQTMLQPINAEELPAEEYRFVKAQQAIYELCRAVGQDTEIKSKLESASNPESFLNIASEYGYEFAIADLQFALQWASEKPQLNTDELDDYELSEEELEAVAGGTATRRSATINSYWHETGICVNNQCFHLLDQSTEARDLVVEALERMELWTYIGNNTVSLTDIDGQYASYKLTGIAYDGLAPALLTDTSGSESYSSNNLLGNILL